MDRTRSQFLTVEIQTGGLSGGAVNRDELEKKLAEMDAKGWDLYAMTSTRTWLGYAGVLLLIFKRPISD